MAQWQRLGARDPKALEDTRLRVHWAAQTIASFAMAHATRAEDDSHRSLEYLSRGDLLVGVLTSTTPPVRLALHPATMVLHLLDLEGQTVGEFSFEGQTLDGAYDWVADLMSELTRNDRRALERPEYDLPPHPFASGAPFTTDDAEAFAEVGRWFGNSALALEALRASTPGAAPVRCWPHHFDIATLIALDDKGSKTIGVGMTPGDGGYAEPYWYVTPWPYPDASELPPIDTGHWHTEGWIGAVLTGSEIVAAGDAEAQHRRTTSFLDAAVAACRKVHGA